MASTPKPEPYRPTDQRSLAQSNPSIQSQTGAAAVGRKAYATLCSTVQLSGAELSRNGLHVRLDDIAR